MGRYKARHFLAVFVLLGLPALMGAAPALLELIERVEFIEQDLARAPTSILLDDDLEDGIDDALAWQDLRIRR